MTDNQEDLEQITPLSDLDSMSNSSTDIMYTPNGHDDEAEINFRRELRRLLKAITCELCGEREPGTQQFLEVELERYKNFLAKYDDKAAQMKGLHSFQLRTHLLLNLQSDLIKLIIEPDLD